MAPYMNHLKFLQTISLLYVLVTLTCTGSSPSHDEECSALFQFKQTIIHQHDAACAAHGSQVLHSWNTSFDCCSWDGVACSNDHDQYYVHVIGLDLSESSLCGYIDSSSTLFNLVHLQRLNLAMNYFGESQIPSEIGRLKQLRSLDLSYSGFSGQIPNEISQLFQLSSLDLSRNPLKLYSPSLKKLVQNLTGLAELHLSGVEISSSVPHFLANFSSLRSIKLRSCSLQNEFPAAIFELPKLQVLDLANNTDLTGSFPEFHGNTLLEEVILPLTGFFGIIPESISHLKHLTVLSLYNCSFSGHIPRSLSNLTQLTVLTLGGNKFTGSVPSLGKMMNSLTPGCQLTQLELSENRFTGQLPRSLTNCRNLEILSLEDNSFHDAFPSWLGSLAELQVLVLRSNNFYGPIQGSSQFPKLRIIDLSNNSFSGHLDQNYFQTWHVMSSENLGISSAMKTIISSKSVFTNMQYEVTLIHKGVKTEYNRILTVVMSIDLSCNQFEGEIPASLQDLQGLQSLNLSNNHFTGSILPSLGNLTNLEALDLSRNELSGEIPQQLVQLGFLSIFNVSFNHLQGRIPQGKQFDTFDKSSYIGNPQLYGRTLSKEGQDLKVPRVPPASNVSESFFPSERIDWIFVFCGIGSGLVVGVVIGNFLYQRYSYRFTKRKERWVRPLRNTRRN